MAWWRTITKWQSGYSTFWISSIETKMTNIHILLVFVPSPPLCLFLLINLISHRFYPGWCSLSHVTEELCCQRLWSVTGHLIPILGLCNTSDLLEFWPDPFNDVLNILWEGCMCLLILITSFILKQLLNNYKHNNAVSLFRTVFRYTCSNGWCKFVYYQLSIIRYTSQSLKQEKKWYNMHV